MRRAISYGLFGKLPSKRDFVAVDIPQAVLTPWETWLQRVVAESRQALGREWLDYFLTAPLWHFQCGAQVLNGAFTGVMMPSVDGVGRYFPLTALACADEGCAWAMPDFAAADAATPDPLETVMLTALDEKTVYEDFLARVRAMTVSGQAMAGPAPWLSAALTGADEQAAAHAALRVWNEQSGFSTTSVWWTRGGENFPPRVLAVQGMPDGGLFSAMLTGNFSTHPLARIQPVT